MLHRSRCHIGTGIICVVDVVKLIRASHLSLVDLQLNLVFAASARAWALNLRVLVGWRTFALIDLRRVSAGSRG